jgi:hypothetical protein
MKRDRDSEAQSVLSCAEASLKAELLEVLPSVVQTGDALFTNSFHNPHGFQAAHISPRAEALHQQARGCVEAREVLRLPLLQSVGQLFLSACDEASSLDPHRRGPRKLASSLLERLSRDT